MLGEKLQLVVGQLHAATYTAATIPALQKIDRYLHIAEAETAAQLVEGQTKLQQYQALGPEFEELARKHTTLLQKINELQYEIAEVEQFLQLSLLQERY
jgi:hypothetical protein